MTWEYFAAIGAAQVIVILVAWGIAMSGWQTAFTWFGRITLYVAVPASLAQAFVWLTRSIG